MVQKHIESDMILKKLLDVFIYAESVFTGFAKVSRNMLISPDLLL